MKKELNPVELDFLLRFPFKAGVVSPVDFLQHQSWGGIKVRPHTQYRTPSNQCWGCLHPITGRSQDDCSAQAALHLRCWSITDLH
jgi:hypothetical protein